MTEEELDHITHSIHHLSDTLAGSKDIPDKLSHKIVSIVRAADRLSSTIGNCKSSTQCNERRMEEIQEVLNAYLLRDFSKVIQLSGAKDNIDAFALSINYFGQDLKASFQQINEQQEILEKKNEEILILLKEVNHRVKNNFQIISSLISIQMRTLTDPLVISYFLNIQNRIYSMAQAHEMLHKTKDFTGVNCQEYIEDVSSNIVNSFNDIETQIELNVDVDDKVSINFDAFTTIGLLINEIMTNSVKHAFQTCKKGKINIQLKRLDNTKCVLIVMDNGKGISMNENVKPAAIGLTIIDALVDQLEGVCLRESSTKGTKYSITFNTHNELLHADSIEG